MNHGEQRMAGLHWNKGGWLADAAGHHGSPPGVRNTLSTIVIELKKNRIEDACELTCRDSWIRKKDQVEWTLMALNKQDYTGSIDIGILPLVGEQINTKVAATWKNLI
jgi:hypothetical protein